MKITVQDGEFIHTYDDSVNTRIKNGFVEEYYTDTHQAIDAVLLLLSNLYDKTEIAKDIKEGKYSIMDRLMLKNNSRL